VSNVEIAKKVIPASASGAVSEARTPTTANGMAPAALAHNPVGYGPLAADDREFVGGAGDRGEPADGRPRRERRVGGQPAHSERAVHHEQPESMFGHRSLRDRLCERDTG
jgi:hypothetical protein